MSAGKTAENKRLPSFEGLKLGFLGFAFRVIFFDFWPY